MRWFISIRYFLSHKRQSLVCIAGVTISVMMFIAMSSMMEGFTDKFIIETVESSGHITIHDEPRETRSHILEQVYKDPDALLALDREKPRDQVKKIKNPEGLLRTLRRLPGIQAVAPMVIGDAIATYGTKTLTINLMGVEPEQQITATTIGDDIVEGGKDAFPRLRTTADGAIIGKGVSDMLGAKFGDTISLSSSTGGRTTARIVGIFQT